MVLIVLSRSPITKRRLGMNDTSRGNGFNMFDNNMDVPYTQKGVKIVEQLFIYQTK